MAGLLAGCEDNRTFDERYEATANHIEQRTAKLDEEASEVEANSFEEDQPET